MIIGNYQYMCTGPPFSINFGDVKEEIQDLKANL